MSGKRKASKAAKRKKKLQKRRNKREEALAGRHVYPCPGCGHWYRERLPVSEEEIDGISAQMGRKVRLAASRCLNCDARVLTVLDQPGLEFTAPDSGIEPSMTLWDGMGNPVDKFPI